MYNIYQYPCISHVFPNDTPLKYPKMLGLIPEVRFFPRYLPVEKHYDVPHTVYDKKKALMRVVRGPFGEEKQQKMVREL